MKAGSLIFGGIALYTLQLCCMSSAISPNTSKATFVGAVQNQDSPYVAVVRDENTESGWAFQIKRDLGYGETNLRILIYFYTKTDRKSGFREAAYSSLCFLLKNNEEYKNYLPKQIARMIFPKETGSCDVIKENEAAIHKTAQVNTNFKDGQSYGFPKKPPYDLEVHFVENVPYRKYAYGKDFYILKLKFNVGGDSKK